MRAIYSRWFITSTHLSEDAGRSDVSNAWLAMSRGSRPCSRKKGLYPVEAETDIFMLQRIGGTRWYYVMWCCCPAMSHVSIVNTD